MNRSRGRAAAAGFPGRSREENKKDDIYYGGITYRAIIEGGIEKDGVKQITTKHFTVDGSEVVFVDYTEVN